MTPKVDLGGVADVAFHQAAWQANTVPKVMDCSLIALTG